MITYGHLKDHLADHAQLPLSVKLPDGGLLPAHFHITEVGHVRKEFIDCGGTRRSASACVLQTLVAHDVDHRLLAGKLSKILGLAAELFDNSDIAVEMEYDFGTTGLFTLDDLSVSDTAIELTLGSKHTACLAPDKCGLDDAPQSVNSSATANDRSSFLNAAGPKMASDPAANC